MEKQAGVELKDENIFVFSHSFISFSRSFWQKLTWPFIKIKILRNVREHVYVVSLLVGRMARLFGLYGEEGGVGKGWGGRVGWRGNYVISTATMSPRGGGLPANISPSGLTIKISIVHIFWVALNWS